MSTQQSGPVDDRAAHTDASTLQATTDTDDLLAIIGNCHDAASTRDGMAQHRASPKHREAERVRQRDERLKLRRQMAAAWPGAAPDQKTMEPDAATVRDMLDRLDGNRNDAYRVLHDPKASRADRIEAGRALTGSGFGRHAAAMALGIDIDGREQAR